MFTRECSTAGRGALGGCTPEESVDDQDYLREAS